MRVLAIRGKNLTSFENFDLDLDSEPLRSSGLFAITGPVGAGKSSLLDALSLALYDRTPRLATKTRNKVLVGRPGTDERTRIDASDVRGVLRHGTAFGYAEVDFVGREGRCYRARWEVRRARYKISGKVQDQSMSLIDLENDQRLGGTKTEVLAEIVERVGLTFDQFRRSVLLPQGEFAAFLHAPARERAELLERMTGTAIYGKLSVAARDRRLEEDKILQVLQAQRDVYIVLEPDQRTELDQRLAEQSKMLRKLDEQLDVARRACDWYERLTRLDTELTTVQKRMASARMQLDEQRAASLAAADTFARQVEAQRSRVASTLESSNRTASEATAVVKGLHRLRPLVEAWPTWKLELRLFAKAAEEVESSELRARELSDQIEGLRDKRKVAESEKQNASRDLDAADQRKAKCQEFLDALDPARVRDRRQQLESRLHAIERVAELCANAARLHEAAAQAHQEAAEAAVERKTIAAALAEAKAAVETAERVLSLNELRARLEPEEPCPLCGSREHPWSEHGAVELDQALRDRAASLEQEHVAVQRRLAAAEQRVEDSKSEAATNTRRAAELKVGAEESASLEELREQLSAERATEEQVVDLQARLRAADREQSMARETFQATSDRLRILDSEDSKLSSQHAHCQDDAGRAGATQARIAAALTKVLDAGCEESLRRDPQAFRKALEAEVAAYQNAEDEARLAERRARCLERVAEKLQDGVLGNDVFLAELRAVAGQTGECEGLVRIVSHELERLASDRSTLQKLERQHEEMVIVHMERERALTQHRETAPPDVSIEDANKQRQLVDSELNVTREAFMELTTTRKQDDQARQKIAELEPKVVAQVERSQVWRVLDELIGSSDGARFRVFAQSLSLGMLLDHANAHLAELAPRYSLMAVPGTDLELQVVDLDMGEEVRSTKSLSGGETFLVSLALALGLSSLSTSRTRVRSLFIDEGFGNLDPDALDTALACLDALQARGRQIGLISHVAGLGERIGVQVLVQPQGSGRSVLRTESATMVQLRVSEMET